MCWFYYYCCYEDLLKNLFSFLHGFPVTVGLFLCIILFKSYFSLPVTCWLLYFFCTLLFWLKVGGDVDWSKTRKPPFALWFGNHNNQWNAPLLYLWDSLLRPRCVFWSLFCLFVCLLWRETETEDWRRTLMWIYFPTLTDGNKGRDVHSHFLTPLSFLSFLLSFNLLIPPLSSPLLFPLSVTRRRSRFYSVF